MPLVAYTDVNDLISRTPAAAWPAVTLVCGEEMLCKKAFDGILAHLVPGDEQALGVERFDGGQDTLGAVLSSLNTYALLSRTKVVVLHDARLFYSASAQQGLREKVVQAAQAGEMKKAARPFVNLLALLGLEFDDLAAASHRKKVADDVDGEPVPWLEQLVAHCSEKGVRIPKKKDDADVLKAAMQNGFPDGHRLLITTDLVDRRKALFKAIEADGLVVDCTVPKGESRADRMAQDAVMQAAVDSALDRAGKRIAADARQRLMQWTGFDLRTLEGNLEKLINFAGDRRTITDADVGSVLQRTRKDPIFAFTGAVAERDLPAALLCMHRLLDDDMHPLQILAALANQLRRLLMAKAFIDRDGGRAWSSGQGYPQFKNAPFQAVKNADQKLSDRLKDWASALNPAPAGKQGKSSPASDLVLVKNPRSPFPVFQTLKHADRFTLDELREAMIDLGSVDLRMKSSGQDHRTLLDAFLIRLLKTAATPTKMT